VVLSKPVGLALRLADDELGALERHSAGDVPASLWQQRENKPVNTNHRAALPRHVCVCDTPPASEPSPAMRSMFPLSRGAVVPSKCDRASDPQTLSRAQLHAPSGATIPCCFDNLPVDAEAISLRSESHAKDTNLEPPPTPPQLCTPPTLSRLHPNSLLLFAVASFPHAPVPTTKHAHSTPLLLLLQINGNVMGRGGEGGHGQRVWP